VSDQGLTVITPPNSSCTMNSNTVIHEQHHYWYMLASYLLPWWAM